MLFMYFNEIKCFIVDNLFKQRINDWIRDFNKFLDVNFEKNLI